MKDIENWFERYRRNKERLGDLGADDDTRAEVYEDLLKLLEDMQNNPPTSGKSQAFMMFVYEPLVNEVERLVWRVRPPSGRPFGY